MDYDKLIEQLKKSADFEDYPVVASFAAIIEKKYLREAATALSTLQAENEKLRAELERVKAERNAAIKDIWVPKWISCKHGESCGFISAVTGMPDCTGCADWEWRGQKED